MVVSKSCLFLVSYLLYLFATNDAIYGTWKLQRNLAFQIYSHNFFQSLNTKHCLFSSPTKMNTETNSCNHSIYNETDKNSSRVYVFKNQATRKFNNQTKKIDSIDSLEEKLKFITSTLLDYDLLNRTIEEWRKPLPKEYISSPLVLVGNY